MRETTMEDRKKELQTLLDQIAEHPERDWTQARERIAVLREMLSAQAAHSHS